MTRGQMTVAVGLFLLGIGGGLGLRLWASSAANAIVGPGVVEIGAGGMIATAAGSHLYVHDRFGELVHKVPVERLGSPAYVGPLLLVDRDTVIMRDDRRMDDSLAAGLQAYAREPDQSVVDFSGPGVLQRCDLPSSTCRPLGSNDFHSRRVFALAPGPGGDGLVVADTMGWELLELDATGAISRRSFHEFAFPNDLVWRDDELWIADTNNHVLARAATEGEDFGRVTDEIPVGRGDYSWPIALAPLPDERWAVVISNTAFDATRVDLIAADGRRLRAIELPEGADILDLAADGDRIYLADFGGFSIHEILGLNAQSGPFGSAEFLGDMAELAERRGRLELLESLALGAMLAALIALLLLNRRWQR